MLSHNGKNGYPDDVVEMALIDFNTTVTDDNKRNYIESIKKLLQTLDVNNNEIANIKYKTILLLFDLFQLFIDIMKKFQKI